MEKGLKQTQSFHKATQITTNGHKTTTETQHVYKKMKRDHEETQNNHKEA